MSPIVKLRKYEGVELYQPCKKTKCESSFNDVPADIFYKICCYLELEEVWRLGLVCSRWYRLTRSGDIWERTDLANMCLSVKESQKFLSVLPPCVKELRIGSCCSSAKQTLALPGLFHVLLERFPQLNVLIIQNAMLTKPYKKFHFIDGFMLNGTVPLVQQIRRDYRVIKYQSREMEADFNTLVCLLQSLTVLSFRNTTLAVEDIFPCANVHITPSKVKILDLSYSPSAMDLTIKSFCRLPFLEELYLSGTAITVNGVNIILTEVHKLKVLDLDDTVVGGETFEVLRKRGKSLVEICLGGTAVRDYDVIDVDDGNFPALKKLCLVNTRVSEIGIKRLLISVPSLVTIVITKSRVKITWVLDQPTSVSEKFKYDDYDKSRKECNHFLQNRFHGEF